MHLIGRRFVVLVLAVLLLVSPARANITPVGRGHVEGGTVLPTANTDVRVLSERLTIDIAPLAGRHVAPLVSVTAEYAMRHEGKTPVNLEMAFPLAGEFQSHHDFYSNPKPVDGLGHTVLLDGQALPARDEPLPLPQTMRSNTAWGREFRMPDEAESRRLTEAFTKCVASDAALAELLAEYSRIVPPRERYARAYDAFKAEAEPLLTRKYLFTSVDQYLWHPETADVYDLVAEADPALRKPTGNGHYISGVRQSARPSPQERAAYRKTIDDWLATRPAIAARHAELLRERDVERAAANFMRDAVGGHLRAKRGLSEFVVARFVQYAQEAYRPHSRGHNGKGVWMPPPKSIPSPAPDEWLVAALDPQIEAERVRRIKEADALLERYGFDSTFLSPLTGLGYSQRVGWRDDSTWDLLAFKAPPTIDEQSAVGKHSFDHGSYRTVVTSPRSEAKLICFAAPFEPGQTRTLRVTYRALAELDDMSMGQGYESQVVHVRYILKTARNWKSFGPIELTVTMPKSGLVVMEPAPDGRRDVDRERLEMKATVKKVDGNLRIAWLPAGTAGRSALLANVKPADLPELRTLERKVQNPQARRVLAAMTGLADQPESTPLSPGSALRGVDNLLGAGFALDDAIQIGAPGGGGGMRAYAVSSAREFYDYVRGLAESGFERDAIFNAPIFRLSADDRRIAAAWAAKVPVKSPTPAVRMSRAYLAMLGTPKPTEAQVAEFLEAARANDDVRYTALKLIAQFPDDPRCFAPLVMEVLARPKPTSTIPDPLPHNTRVAAVGAFAHGAAAPLEDAMRMLDAFDDHEVALTYRVGELYRAEIGSDRTFAICERLVRSPKDAHALGWIRVLNKIDPVRARRAVAEWAKSGALKADEVKQIEEQLDRGY
jgi:hypothetical protein